MIINDLKKYEGFEIEFIYNGEYRKFKLCAVQLTHELIFNKFRGDIGDFYLEHLSDEPNGFWTKNMDRVKVPQETKDKIADIHLSNDTITLILGFLNATLTETNGIVQLSTVPQDIAKNSALVSIERELTNLMWLNLLCNFDNPMKVHIEDKLKQTRKLKEKLLSM